MKRVMIIGCSGSGKSTFAKRLHQQTNLPLIHLDQHYWRPHWVEPSPAIWAEQMQALVAQEAWIMDGNYSGTMEFRLARADTIIFLDLPTSTCLQRVIGRTLKYWRQSRSDMSKDCPERFSLQFFHYILFYRKTRRAKILQKLAAATAHQQVFVLSSTKAVAAFWETFK